MELHGTVRRDVCVGTTPSERHGVVSFSWLSGSFLLITPKCRFDVASHDYRLESRPHWSFDVWAGRVREEMMGTLFFVCPATGEEVSTGLEMDLPTLQRLELGRVYCPNCRQQHQMAGIKYWLSEVYLLETEPVEPVKAA
jgi:hypothetical protein